MAVAVAVLFTQYKRTGPAPPLLLCPSPQNAFGEEIRFTSNDPANPGVEVPLNVVTNLFCSAGQLLADGSLLSVGGSTDSSAFDPIYNGSYSIRSYSSPCLEPSCSFKLLGNMTDRRWYPTTQVLYSHRTEGMYCSCTSTVLVDSRWYPTTQVLYCQRTRVLYCYRYCTGTVLLQNTGTVACSVLERMQG